MSAPDFANAVWRKSNHSADTANCVEIAFAGDWRKSSRSQSTANCVEVSFSDAAVAARDSKNPDGPILAFPATSWAGFLSYARSAPGTARTRQD
ncbi:DUF397 domain-containing protein [Solihabitans fulvus]|uniref:DUF397 domain-containing protein n=1 Tax=Solihabitans fulvus TaxID=1892852 RepID=A0A5B2XJP0_9PSEU|nr:DUF397 domain-containing protein [Solihabitans fulvus]KAA2262982.1 DUF397 domain-containing protein [Solihabitans fulvus]